MRTLLACFLALCLSRALTPTSMRLARRIGAVDVPRDWRRMHRKAVPRAGGVAILLGILAATLTLGAWSRFLVWTAVGGVCFGAVGLVDDIYCLGPWSKLLLQVGVTLAVTWGIGTTGGWMLLCALWILTLVNAHNFIDGLDGVLGGCVALEGAFLGLTLLSLGASDLGAVAWITSLSCLGFLRYNRHPARTFAGDCGSESLGFLMGMLSLPLLGWRGGGVMPLCPLFLFAYPLTDLSASVLRRILRGKSPFAADRGHLHHRLCAAGLDHPRCVGVLLSLTASLGLLGFLLRDLTAPWAASGACLLSALLLILLRRYVIRRSHANS
ncbi:MAG: undecaprenyl/decaprenyl-phosphate alpha-N-acetylglucosaminyl 1-phosphate transferase [Clostridia bacterium]|nr:undecaprenyl/decaprenyl-phosphate alpha-N-acetylglucosaminyl 1-phosphate transferase [Clostridia bacterium]